MTSAVRSPLVVSALAALLLPAAGLAGEPAARVKSVAGVLLARSAADATWHTSAAQKSLAAGTTVIAMPRSELVSGNGAVQLNLLADIGKRGPLPVLETAVTLHAPKDADLDISFDRGLIVITNLKKEGEATVRLRVGGEQWLLRLHDPGTKVGLEYYSRLQPGIPKDLKKVHEPIAEVIGLVLEGAAFVDVGKEGVGLRAPPGPAWLHWDSAHRKLSVRRLDKLPEILVKPLDDREDKLFKEIIGFTVGVESKKLGAWLKKLGQGNGAVPQMVAVTVAGALDDLPRVIEILETSKHAEVRNHAVVVLRHWLGRKPGQVQSLFDKLTTEKKLTEVQARSALQLLIGFDEEEKERPETYEMLIGYLKHSKQAVRELAHWHLVRLAPAGKDIPYDAAAPEPERLKAYERWRALIPEGQLPPPPEPVKIEKK